MRRLLATHSDVGTCEGLGLVVPGMVDHATGRVLNAPHLGWRNVDVRDALSEAVGLPVFVENAPIACALAPMWLGQRGAAELSDFVYVSVSDGVGTGVVANGQVMRGKHNTAGEFGHVPLSTDGPDCHCGGQGCLETYSSDLATVVRYLGHDFSPTTARSFVQASGLTMADVVVRITGRPRSGGQLVYVVCTLGRGQSALHVECGESAGEYCQAWHQLRGGADRLLGRLRGAGSGS
ncbi:hypothetical protein BH11GEM1_BH11GEM1_16150 [soil metagenome]